VWEPAIQKVDLRAEAGIDYVNSFRAFNGKSNASWRRSPYNQKAARAAGPRLRHVASRHVPFAEKRVVRSVADVCEAVAVLGGLKYFRGVYSFTTITDVIGKYHDGFAVPTNIYEPVAVQRTIEYFNFGTFWNHNGDFGVILSQDRQGGTLHTKPLPDHTGYSFFSGITRLRL
jgi:hypothetical protein